MLVQVVKEERGTKGAALTTYLSLAGRYSVLMPNTARGGGISRKITSGEDRSRLKEIAQELEVPEGMGVIVRTAGASRTKTEIKRDFEYLLRLWETVRDLTLKSTAPKLVYEEGSLVKRSIRDLYSKDIDEVIVAGPEAYQEAKDFMRMLMPSHAKNVKLYSDTQPLLSRYGVENQLDGMFSPVVQLRSGGYIVLNQAEALVAIDVNSGRATREHHIEDTALKTNLEASDEIARQLRLRDLAGLIVIDFIDMDEKRNNRSVERRLKECLKQDRARIQVGRISHFGLLEMSRQRIRTSVLESSTEKCPYCGGSGHVRSVSSLALQVLRALEEQLMKGATHNLIARTRPDVALYVLNQKRAHLRALEERFAITITISADDTLIAPQAFAIDRGEQVHTIEAAKALAARSETTRPRRSKKRTTSRRLPRWKRKRARKTRSTAAEAAAEQPAEGATGEAGAAGGGGAGGAAAAMAAKPMRSRTRHDRIRRSWRRGATTMAARCPPTISQKRPAKPPVLNRNESAGRRRAAAAAARPPRRPAQPARSGSARERRRRTIATRTSRSLRSRDRRRLDAPPATEPDLHRGGRRSRCAPPASLRGGSADPARRRRKPPPPPAEPEPPRRRSTVREPAPIVGSERRPRRAGTGATRLLPRSRSITEVGDSEDADRPRRSGWWSRRFAGG